MQLLVSILCKVMIFTGIDTNQNQKIVRNITTPTIGSGNPTKAATCGSAPASARPAPAPGRQCTPRPSPGRPGGGGRGTPGISTQSRTRLSTTPRHRGHPLQSSEPGLLLTVRPAELRSVIHLYVNGVAGIKHY